MAHTSSQKQVFIKTLGCKVNTFDSHALESQFRAAGYSVTDSAAEAEVTVINTCSVTQNAEKEARMLLRRYQRANPEGLRVVTGCYAQIHSGSLASLKELDYIVPNEAKEQLVGLVQKISSSGEKPSRKLPDTVDPVFDNKQTHFKSAAAFFDSPRSNRTRAFVKVQDGCNGFCSYCQIPYARGASRSVAAELVLQEVKKLCHRGVVEIVLTGIHIGDYGCDLASGVSLSGLIASILEENPNLLRLRISSLEPSEAPPELIATLARYRDRICDHFHFPLQSGSARILRLMRRKYSLEEYRETIERVRETFPNAHFSADLIVGFPSESDEDFAETVAFCRDLGLASLHVFPYSKRPNTAALRMPGHLAPELITKRAAELRRLSKELFHSYASRFVSESVSVLWEAAKDGRAIGKSSNYLTITANDLERHQAGSQSVVHLKGFWDSQSLLGV